MIRFIFNFYLATTTASLIAFVLNFRRLDRYYRKQGLQAVFNEDSLVCLLMCFIPIRNIKYGISYWNGAMWTDEQFEEYFNENDLEE
ncbi:MAG: hypothetical protein ACI4PU_01855 [Intestinibacter sp.]